jgi:hypothetical protein
MQILINLKIKVSEGDIIVTPIPPDVPITPEVPIIPPTNEVIDITQLWYDTFSKGYGDITLESGKIYTINTVRRQRINGKVRIKTSGVEPAYVWVGKAMYVLYIDEGEDTVLFELADGADVVVDNIWPSLREQDRNVQQMYSVNWFTSVQDPNARWTAIVKNCDSTYLGKNGGFGTGVLYGGNRENYVSFINYKHAGPSLMELKNPYPNSVMYLVMENVTTDYTNPYDWSKRAHLTTGTINKTNNVLSLTGDVEASCLYNHFFIVDKGANRSFLAHIDRFTFMVDNIDAVIDLKNIQLRPSPKAGEKVLVKGGRFFFNGREPHVGDSLRVNGVNYTIREKMKTENDEWTNNFGSGNSPLTVKAPQCSLNEPVQLSNGEYNIESYTSSFNQFDINQPIYLIYKDDLNFRTTMNTKFGDWQVLEARGGNHIAYNHRSISIWAKDVDLNSGMVEGNDDPYYRESTNGEGITLGYNIVNCKGFDDEFSTKPITTDKPMPDRIKNLL